MLEGRGDHCHKVGFTQTALDRTPLQIAPGPGMEHVGTADAIIPERLLVIDLKSGKVRNYREQVAA